MRYFIYERSDCKKSKVDFILSWFYLAGYQILQVESEGNTV